MKLISVNVALPQVVTHSDRTFTTGIFKKPVSGRIPVRDNNLEGDAQADLSVHGGPEKAVYAYPSEHYPFWEERLRVKLDWAAFGENLTTRGLLESDVCIGDRYQVGSVILKVTQPRLPCYKLAVKLERGDIIKLFRESGRSGFYFSVVQEGDLGVGDAIRRLWKSSHGISIADVNRLELEPGNTELLERVLSVPDLSTAQRKHLKQRRSKPS